MAMSDAYGPAVESESPATLQAAIDSEITFLDTGDFYGFNAGDVRRCQVDFESARVIRSHSRRCGCRDPVHFRAHGVARQRTFLN